MNNKKGFTLVEIIAVIVVLAIIIVIASSTVLTGLDRSRKQAQQLMEEDLEDAAVTYALKKLSLPKCNTSFDVEHPSGTCYKEVTVKTLKDGNYFNDESNHCKEDATVLIYHYSDGNNSEYRAFIAKDTCNQ